MQYQLFIKEKKYSLRIYFWKYTHLGFLLSKDSYITNSKEKVEQRITQDLICINNNKTKKPK